MILPDIVFQHAEDASALWHRRQIAVNEPHYSLSDLEELDLRVSANIEGLLVAGDESSRILRELIQAEDDGALFTLALLGLENGNQSLFQEALELAKGSAAPANAYQQVQSALAWANPQFLSGIVRELLDATDEIDVTLGLHACQAHQKLNPKLIESFLYSDSLRVRTVATRIAANAGFSTLLPTIKALVLQQAEVDEFEYYRAITLLGNSKEALAPFNKHLLKESNSKTREAFALFFNNTSPNEGRALLKQLDGMADRERDVIIGFGILGDPVAIPWLINKMQKPEYNRLAGESISMITGVDISLEKLELENPPETDSGPNDDPEDDNVALEEDEDLPWVSPDLITQWWQSQPSYRTGTRFLTGKPYSVGTCHSVLKLGLQRHRAIASISIANDSPETKLLDTHLPTTRQLEQLP